MITTRYGRQVKKPVYYDPTERDANGHPIKLKDDYSDESDYVEESDEDSVEIDSDDESYESSFIDDTSIQSEVTQDPEEDQEVSSRLSCTQSQPPTLVPQSSEESHQ
jgi:hypothetical protein